VMRQGGFILCKKNKAIYCQPDLWMVATLEMRSYWPSSLQPQSYAQWFSLLWTPYAAPGWQEICNTCRHEARCNFLATDTSYWFLLCWDTSLRELVRKCWNVSGESVEVWCVPSTADVYHPLLMCTIHYWCVPSTTDAPSSQNRVLSITVFVVPFLKPFRSNVGPRPTLWFSCSTPMSEDVRHFFCWVCSPVPLSEPVRCFSSCSMDK
jgi:hypothetical protein